MTAISSDVPLVGLQKIRLVEKLSSFHEHFSPKVVAELRHEPFMPVAELLSALGVARSGLPIELYDNGPQYLRERRAPPFEPWPLRPDGTLQSETSPVRIGRSESPERRSKEPRKYFKPPSGK